MSARAISKLAAAVVAAVLVASLFLWALGADPVLALRALVRGSLGDARALESTLLRFCPLALVGLAVTLAFRAGVWNIGGEGQLYIGALVATAIATRALDGAPALVLAPALLAGGALGGALWGGIAALLKVSRGVSEVLSTILLNFIAALAVAWAVHGPLQEASGAYPQSDAFPAAARLATLPGLSRLHLGLVLALAMLPLVWFLLFRTAVGLRLRAVGLAPDAARYAGIDPARETLGVLAVSGSLAGLAGAIEVAGVTGRLFENLSAGYGFTAIAVALLARLHPLAVLPAAFFFAVLATGSAAMQRSAGVPSVTVRAIEGVVILLSVSAALPGLRSR